MDTKVDIWTCPRKQEENKRKKKSGNSHTIRSTYPELFGLLIAASYFIPKVTVLYAVVIIMRCPTAVSNIVSVHLI